MPTVLVTGANRGLGYAFASEYAADKWRVIACCRSPGKASALKKLAEENDAVQIEALDITDDSAIAALAKKLKDTPIDLLINNAGIFSGTGIDGHVFMEGEDDKTQAFGTIESAAWAKVLRTNTIAPVMVTQGLIENIKRGKDRKVVMISSKMGSIGQIGHKGDIAYRTSKAALNAAAKSLSFNLKKDRIMIACFHPGWVKTDMGGKPADITPQRSVRSMKRVISTLTLDNGCQFLSYDGQQIPW